MAHSVSVYFDLFKVGKISTVVFEISANELATYDQSTPWDKRTKKYLVVRSQHRRFGVNTLIES